MYKVFVVNSMICLNLIQIIGETSTGSVRRKLPRTGRGPKRKNSDTFRNKFNPVESQRSTGTADFKCSQAEIKSLQQSNEKEINRLEDEVQSRKKIISDLEEKILNQKKEHSSEHSEMSGEVSLLEERLQSRKQEINNLEQNLREEREQNRALSVEKLSQVSELENKIAGNKIEIERLQESIRQQEDKLLESSKFKVRVDLFIKRVRERGYIEGIIYRG